MGTETASACKPLTQYLSLATYSVKQTFGGRDGTEFIGIRPNESSKCPRQNSNW